MKPVLNRTWAQQKPVFSRKFVTVPKDLESQGSRLQVPILNRTYLQEKKL